jgi:AraC family transcriptional regulator
MQSSGEGEWLHRRFHSAVRTCFVAGAPDVAPQATFTSLRAEHWTRLGDVTPEDAYTLHLNRRSSTSISLCGRYGGRERHNIPFRGATLFDLSDLPMVEVEGRYDMLRVYLPRRRMISVAESMARRSDVRLRLPKPGFDDCIIKNLLNIINFALDNPERTSQLFIDEISVLLMSHLIHTYSDVSPVEPRTRGGLASWQERIAKEILFARIRNPPTIDELGQACGVSARHFIRAFRQSTGLTPHQWQMQERALSAKNLLEHSDRTLAEISAMCGYANQSHLCRAFLRCFGQSPSRTRRQAATAPTPLD